MFLMDIIKNKLKYFSTFFYSRQVRLSFPVLTIEKYVNYQWQLPEGYILVSPSKDVDCQAWAALLNSDSNFGMWTPARVKTEIIDRMIMPDAGSLLYYNGELIGCSSTMDGSKHGRRLGVGMWLFLTPNHRGTKRLAHALTYRTLSFFVKAGYDKIIAYTDSTRLPALYLYLSNGAVPNYNSIISFFIWHKILKRLRPLLKRSKNHNLLK